ncbi:MAG: hypothetical protein WBO06_11755 [Gammaproteobacteria bacterium]|jgi:hypothetical protein
MLTAPQILPAEVKVVEPPSMELLDFLVEWETEDGQWVDPAVLESTDWQETGPVTLPASETGEAAND